MGGHDAQKTRQSQFNAGNNLGNEKWKFSINGSLVEQSPVIDKNGILYVSTTNSGLYAIYPNGTQKWHQDLDGFNGQQPALGPDGTIYIATNDHLHAFYLNGSIRWKLNIDHGWFADSPIIQSMGTIYIGTDDGFIYSINSNGTIKWTFQLGYPIISLSVDLYDNLYTSAYDLAYLYSFFPNGTVRWTFKLPSYNFDAPTIGSDGTIYVAAWNDLIAINQNGTEKWRYNTKVLSGSPALAPDGTIILSPWYFSDVIALDPNDGHLVWRCNLGDQHDKSRPAISNDGTIFIAYVDFTGERAYLAALNPDGNLKWTSRLTHDNSIYDAIYIADPSISADGTIYVRSEFEPNSTGFIHAFGTCNPNAPTGPIVIGPTQGQIDVPYNYTIRSQSPLGKDLYYFIDWGDSDFQYHHEKWMGPYHSNQTIRLTHIWDVATCYDVRVIARDSDGLEGPRSAQRLTTISQSNLTCLSLIGGLRLKVNISDSGIDAHNITWNITLKGKIIHHVYATDKGQIGVLFTNHTITIKPQLKVMGFGIINIIFNAHALSSNYLTVTRTALIFGPILIPLPENI